MEKSFQIFTVVLMCSLLLSAVLHVALFMSDSPEYRRWVQIQIGLQLCGAGVLWYVRKYKVIALAAFVALSLPFTYINAVYVNYGHVSTHMILVPLFWVTYGMLILGVRRQFVAKSATTGRRDA